MPRQKRPTLTSLKAEVWSELKRGRDIVEAELASKEMPHYGLCVDDRTVYIDPAPSIIDSVLHELLHRTHPRMSEKHVAAFAARIMRRMSRRELRRWLAQYRVVARKRRTPFNVDAA